MIFLDCYKNEYQLCSLKLEFYNVRICWKFGSPLRSLTHLYFFLQLAAVCDVFVENYIPGKLSAMGLGYADIDKIAPHIIYCSITGISVPHPYQWVGFPVSVFLCFYKTLLTSGGFLEAILFSLSSQVILGCWKLTIKEY